MKRNREVLREGRKKHDFSVHDAAPFRFLLARTPEKK